MNEKLLLDYLPPPGETHDLLFLALDRARAEGRISSSVLLPPENPSDPTRFVVRFEGDGFALADRLFEVPGVRGVEWSPARTRRHP